MSVALVNGACLGEAAVNLAKLGLHASAAARPIINDDHHADGGMDGRGRGVARHSRSVLTGPIEAGLLD